MTTKRIFKFSTLALTACTAAVLCAPNAAHAEAFTPEQKTEMQKMFEAYLMEHPEVIMKSVDEYRKKMETQGAEEAKKSLVKYKEIFSNKDMPMVGNPDGDVTMVEFFDFNCGYCKRMFADIQELVKADTKLRIVFVDLPVLGPASALKSQYALAAHKQGKYFDMHKALMEHNGAQTDEAILELAKGLGLDVDKLKKDKDDPSTMEVIGQYHAMAQDLGIRGTPGLIIGDEIIPGYIGLDGSKEAIAKVRGGADAGAATPK